MSNAFSASIEMILWFLCLSLFAWYSTCIDLHMLNLTYVEHMPFYDKVLLIVMYNPFNVFLGSVCKYFVGNFCICLFFVVSLPDLGIRIT